MVIVSSDRRSTSCALSKHPDPALGLNKAGGEFVPPPRIRSVMARYVRCAHEVPTITRRCPRPVATTSGPVGRSSSFRWTGLRKLRRTAPQFRGPLWRWLDVPIPRSKPRPAGAAPAALTSSRSRRSTCRLQVRARGRQIAAPQLGSVFLEPVSGLAARAGSVGMLRGRRRALILAAIQT